MTVEIICYTISYYYDCVFFSHKGIEVWLHFFLFFILSYKYKWEMIRLHLDRRLVCPYLLCLALFKLFVVFLL